MLGTWYGFWTWGGGEPPMPPGGDGFGGWQAAVHIAALMSFLLLIVRW